VTLCLIWLSSAVFRQSTVPLPSFVFSPSSIGVLMRRELSPVVLDYSARIGVLVFLSLFSLSFLPFARRRPVNFRFGRPRKSSTPRRLSPRDGRFLYLFYLLSLFTLFFIAKGSPTRLFIRKPLHFFPQGLTRLMSRI